MKQNSDMAEDQMQEIIKRLGRIETALMGDTFGNEGHSQRIHKLEKSNRRYERIVWIATGGAGVVTIVVNLIFILI